MNGTHSNLPLAGYIRVSRVGGRDRTDGFISPDVQRDAIEEWSRRKGVPVVVHEPELNRSGGTMDRPVFNEIMRLISEGERGGIVVYRIDRFARSLLGALTTLAQLGEHSAAFASTSQEISYVSAHERAFLQMQFVFAEYMRATIAENWQTATSSAVDRGIHISNQPTFGYDRDPESRLLVPNEQAKLVEDLFRLRGDRWGWHRLCSLLDERAPLGGGRRWGVTRVQRLVANPVYLGEARYGDKINPVAHPPIVSPDVFHRAQDAKGVSLARRPDKPPLLLQGLARCASCRYTLKENQTRKRDGNIRSYRCQGRAVHGRCPGPQYIGLEKLEDFVVEQFKAHLRRTTGRALPSSGELSAARELLADAETELRLFNEDVAGAQRLRALGLFDSAFDARVSAVEEARSEVDRLTLQAVGSGLGDLARWQFDIDAWWDAASPDARKAALASAIDCVFVRGPGGGDVAERTLILWRGEAPEDLPRRGRQNGPLRAFDWA